MAGQPLHLHQGAGGCGAGSRRGALGEGAARELSARVAAHAWHRRSTPTLVREVHTPANAARRSAPAAGHQPGLARAQPPPVAPRLLPAARRQGAGPHEEGGAPLLSWRGTPAELAYRPRTPPPPLAARAHSRARSRAARAGSGWRLPERRAARQGAGAWRDSVHCATKATATHVILPRCLRCQGQPLLFSLSAT